MRQNETHYPSQKEIAQWKSKAEQGDAEAQFLLGECYEGGEGVKSSLEKARYWYAKAAEQGHEVAKECLEMLNVTREQAEQWIHESEQGDPDVLYRLAEWYEAGIGVERDYKMAKEYYTRAFKAKEKGDAIDRFLDQRRYQEKIKYLDKLLQVEHWEEMAEQGDDTAMLLLAKYYEYDADYRSELKPERAIYWLKKSAEGGNTLAQVSMGVHYEIGMVVNIDHNEAFRLYALAAEQGDAWGEYYIGHCYERGIGVEVDIEEAIRWYTESALQNETLSRHAIERIRDWYGFPGHQNPEYVAMAEEAIKTINDEPLGRWPQGKATVNDE